MARGEALQSLATRTALWRHGHIVISALLRQMGCVPLVPLLQRADRSVVGCRAQCSRLRCHRAASTAQCTAPQRRSVQSLPAHHKTSRVCGGRLLSAERREIWRVSQRTRVYTHLWPIVNRKIARVLDVNGCCDKAHTAVAQRHSMHALPPSQHATLALPRE